MSRIVLRVVLALGLALPAVFLQTAASADNALPQSADQLAADYKAAVAATAAPTPAMAAVEDWTVISPETPGQTWRDTPSGPQVLMEYWTGYTGYNDMVGQTVAVDATTDRIWSTPVAELKDYLDGVDIQASGGLTTTLDKVLGLPPTNAATTVVEFWVAAEDLIRPSVNPDPTATHDQGYGLTTFVNRLFGNQGYDIGSKSFNDWFDDRRDSIYSAASPYPWTGFGYTYDWGAGDSNQGVGEFVVRPGADIVIQSVSTTAEYFE